MRLLAATEAEDIERVLISLKKETRAIVDHINEICWYMRGGITREEAYSLSYEERLSVAKLIETNIKRVNDTKLPIL